MKRSGTRTKGKSDDLGTSNTRSIAPGKRPRTASRASRGPIARKAAGAATADAGAAFASATRSGAGPVPYQGEMERAFGHDFSSVKAYTGRSVQMKSMGARAAAQGESVAFASSNPGREVVAHELAHVVQSRASGGHGVHLSSRLSQPSDAAEVEADQVAAGVVSRIERGEAAGAPVTVQASTDGGIHRLADSTAVQAVDHATGAGYDGHAAAIKQAFCQELVVNPHLWNDAAIAVPALSDVADISVQTPRELARGNGSDSSGSSKPKKSSGSGDEVSSKPSGRGNPDSPEHGNEAEPQQVQLLHVGGNHFDLMFRGQVVRVRGDGGCFFHALATGVVLAELDDIGDNWSDALVRERLLSALSRAIADKESELRSHASTWILHNDTVDDDIKAFVCDAIRNSADLNAHIPFDTFVYGVDPDGDLGSAMNALLTAALQHLGGRPVESAGGSSTAERGYLRALVNEQEATQRKSYLKELYGGDLTPRRKEIDKELKKLRRHLELYDAAIHNGSRGYEVMQNYSRLRKEVTNLERERELITSAQAAKKQAIQDRKAAEKAWKKDLSGQKKAAKKQLSEDEHALDAASGTTGFMLYPSAMGMFGGPGPNAPDFSMSAIRERERLRAKIAKDKADLSQLRDKKKRQKQVVSVVDHIASSQAKHSKFMSFADKLLDQDVGKVALQVFFGVSAGNELVLKGGAKVVLKGELWVEDDRKFRMRGSIDLVGSAGNKAVSGEASLSIKNSVWVFNSAEQWAAWAATKVASKVQKAKGLMHMGPGKVIKEKPTEDNLDMVAQLKAMGLDTEEAENIYRYAQQDVTKVYMGGGKNRSAQVQGNLFGVLGLTGLASYTAMKFVKKDPNDPAHEVKKWGRKKVVSGSIKILGGLFSLDITRTKIEGHANPDNDGTYRNLKLGFNGGLFGADVGANERAIAILERVLFTPLTDQIADEDFNSPHENTFSKWVGRFTRLIEEGWGRSLQAFWSDSKLGKLKKLFKAAAGSTGFGLEWNFISDEDGALNPFDYKLQYMRKFGSWSMGGEASINTGTPVNVDVGGSVGLDEGTDLRLGTGTLTYLLTVYNGMAGRDASASKAGATPPGGWRGYVDKHRPEVWTIFNKIASGESHIRQQMDQSLKEAQTVKLLRDQWALANSPQIGGGLASISTEGPDTDRANLALVRELRPALLQAGRELIAACEAIPGAVKNRPYDSVGRMYQQQFERLLPYLDAYFAAQAAVNNMRSYWTRRQSSR